MGVQGNTYSQEDLDNTIAVLENELIYWVTEAAHQDNYGNWEQAECFLAKAKAVSQGLFVLRSICPGVDKSPFVNENSGVILCDIENDKGIGEWAITPSIRGCGVLRVRGGQGPPPYGEFVQQEFVPEEFTEVIT